MKSFCMTFTTLYMRLCTSHPSPNRYPSADLSQSSTYAVSANFNSPSRLILFGLSIGNPSALSQINCANGPNPLLTPNVAV